MTRHGEGVKYKYIGKSAGQMHADQAIQEAQERNKRATAERRIQGVDDNILRQQQKAFEDRLKHDPDLRGEKRDQFKETLGIINAEQTKRATRDEYQAQVEALNYRNRPVVPHDQGELLSQAQKLGLQKPGAHDQGSEYDNGGGIFRSY